MVEHRDPRTSDPWRLIDRHFETFQRVYDERFQAKYGPLTAGRWAQREGLSSLRRSVLPEDGWVYEPDADWANQPLIQGS